MADIKTTIASGGISAAVTIIVVSELSRWGVTVGAEEAAAFGTVLATVLHYVSQFLPQPKETPNA